MKKLALKLILLSLAITSFAGCSSQKGSVEDIKFENVTVTYDGAPHSLSVANLPEGYTVEYSKNGLTDAGIYVITATISNGKSEEIKKDAMLTINRAESILTVPSNFVGYALEGGVEVKYTLNNDEQSLSLQPFKTPGVYNLELYAEQSKNYKESNHVQTTVTVREGLSGFLSNVKFESQEFIYDGTEKQILATNIPGGYTVTYENNKATEAGTYFATCDIKSTDGRISAILHAIMDIDNPDYEPFNTYCNEFFVEYIGDDCEFWNLFANDPASLGYVRGKDVKAGFYYYDHEFQDPNYYSDYVNELGEALKELEEFKDKPLSKNQMISYRAIQNTLTSDLEYYDPSKNYNPYQELLYVDQFGGYVAQFNSMVEGYIFRNEQDIIDVEDYIKSAPASFASYIDFVDEKTKAGYPYSDYTLNECIKFINESTKGDVGQDYYLVDFVNDKIDQTDLSSSKKDTYKTELKELINLTLVPAYKKFASDLEQYKGKLVKANEGYYSVYENGSRAYLNSLRSITGMKDVSVEMFYKDVKAATKEWMNKYFAAAETTCSSADDKTKYQSLQPNTRGQSSPIFKDLDTPEKMLDYLKEFAKTMVPDLTTNPDIIVNHMSEAEQKSSNAVAYYRKSALDGAEFERITLNDLQLGNPNETLFTLAHEGYPGHLYEYVFSKSLNISNYAKVFSSVGHAEGWATYVSYKLYDYIAENYNGTGAGGVRKFCAEEQAYNVFAYLLYTFVDVCINGKQLNEKDCRREISSLGLNPDLYKDLQPLLIEMPAEYASYGYGQYLFIKLHNKAQEKLGSYYNEVEFNKWILSEGWCSLVRVNELADDYINRMSYIYNL